MAPTTRNPAGCGDGGARDRLAWRLDGPNLSANRRALQDSARIDELLCRLTDRLRFGRLDEWQAKFAKSVLRQARRGGPRWMPSPKQLAIMEDIAEAQPDEGAESLIEPEVPDGWIP